MKNYPNLTRKHSKEPHDPKLSKTIRFIMIKHVEKNFIQIFVLGVTLIITHHDITFTKGNLR